MRSIVLIAVVMFLSISSVAQHVAGIKPRSKADSYPAVSDQATLALGVAQLSEKQVRRTFVSSLGKKYIVLEVGAFPKNEVQLSPQDFVLVVRSEKQEIRPADPDEIATKLAKKEEVNHDVTVSPVVGVTYSSGYDPYDRYSQRGWSTTTGVAVQTGGQSRDPKTVDADRTTIATELKEKQLPSGASGKAVAGYLYFPAPDTKSAAFDLEYRGSASKAIIPLRPASN